MSWIEEFSQSTYAMFAGNVLEGFQPIDFFHFFPGWYGLFIKRIAAAITALGLEEKPYSKIAPLLPGPSNLRCILLKIVTTYAQDKEADVASYRLVTNFLARILQESCPDDPFAQRSNPFLLESPTNLDLGKLSLIAADPFLGRKVGRITTAAGSLVHGLYNDWVTDLSWDVYGPYSVTYGGKDTTLLVRHFSNLQPRELWNDSLFPSVKEIKLYTFYEGMEWEISVVGCHTLPKSGNPVESLRYFSLLVDGQLFPVEKIDSLVDELSQKAEVLYRKIRSYSVDELKQMVLMQEAYQFKTLFEAAGFDWQPSTSLKELVEHTPIPDNFYPYGTLMNSQEEYEKVFNIARFKAEVVEGYV